MKIAAIMEGNTQPGDQIIILSKSEAQDMYCVYQEYCKQNPKKKKKAKKVFQQMEDEFEIW